MVHYDKYLGKGDEVNPLMVPLFENAPSQKEIAAKWFSEDVFTDADAREDLKYDDSKDKMQVDVRKIQLKIHPNNQ